MLLREITYQNFINNTDLKWIYDIYFDLVLILIMSKQLWIYKYYVF